MNRVKIISDGTSYGTKITDMEGKTIIGISSLTWSVEAGDGLARAVVVFDNVEVDVVGEVIG